MGCNGLKVLFYFFDSRRFNLSKLLWIPFLVEINKTLLSNPMKPKIIGQLLWMPPKVSYSNGSLEHAAGNPHCIVSISVHHQKKDGTERVRYDDRDMADHLVKRLSGSWLEHFGLQVLQLCQSIKESRVFLTNLSLKIREPTAKLSTIFHLPSPSSFVVSSLVAAIVISAGDGAISAHLPENHLHMK